LRQVPAVEYAVVFGAGRAAPVALVSIASSTAADIARPERSAGEANLLLATCSRLRVEVTQALQELPPHLQPRGLVVTTRPLTIESGELTSNLKLRRHTIERTYAAYLGELDRRLEAAAGDRWPIEGESDVVLCRL
jgi:long-subunit acyl-CoA synthetase (AMP-forming)